MLARKIVIDGKISLLAFGFVGEVPVIAAIASFIMLCLPLNIPATVCFDRSTFASVPREAHTIVTSVSL